MSESKFRHYADNDAVRIIYENIYQNQTISYVKEQLSKCDAPLFSRPFTVNEILKLLDSIIDESDPDTKSSQTIHALQAYTAMIDMKDTEIKSLFNIDEWNELPTHIQELYKGTIKLPDYMPLIALIHDFGKVLCVLNYPQWSVVGDTFAVGLPLESCHPYSNLYKISKELDYDKKCGLSNILISFGHDEYMAKVLERSNTLLPPEAIYLIRFHSLYSWHTPCGKRAYTQYASQMDWDLLPLLKILQKCDLYSKHDGLIYSEIPIDLIEKYKCNKLIL